MSLYLSEMQNLTDKEARFVSCICRGEIRWALGTDKDPRFTVPDTINFSGLCYVAQ